MKKLVICLAIVTGLLFSVQGGAKTSVGSDDDSGSSGAPLKIINSPSSGPARSTGSSESEEMEGTLYSSTVFMNPSVALAIAISFCANYLDDPRCSSGGMAMMTMVYSTSSLLIGIISNICSSDPDAYLCESASFSFDKDEEEGTCEGDDCGEDKDAGSAENTGVDLGTGNEADGFPLDENKAVSNDADADGVKDREDKCDADAETYDDATGEPLDGVLDGCPEEDAGKATGGAPVGFIDSGDGSCTLLSGTAASPLGFLMLALALLPLARKRIK